MLKGIFPARVEKADAQGIEVEVRRKTNIADKLFGRQGVGSDDLVFIYHLYDRIPLLLVVDLEGIASALYVDHWGCADHIPFLKAVGLVYGNYALVAYKALRLVFKVKDAVIYLIVHLYLQKTEDKEK